MKIRFQIFAMILFVAASIVMAGCSKDDTKTENGSETENDYFKLSDAKHVEIASSNLYWDGESFHFEQNPYDYPKEWNPEHVGHFYWSKNINQTYAKDYEEYDIAQISDIFCWDERYKTSRMVDGDTGWYLPSVSEWEYLIGKHIHFYCDLVKTTGDTVFGLMVLPFGSKQFIQQGNRITPDKRTTYTLSMADFQTNIEHHAIFLPGAYIRDGRRIDYSRDGDYLSSTPLQSMANAAECFNFYEYGISAWFILGKSLAGTIRLVRNR